MWDMKIFEKFPIEKVDCEIKDAWVRDILKMGERKIYQKPP